ncbi:insulin-like growth factor-binding protein complex acid labile subunit [Drosophila novamexicana]|uniref:insulin-like growth factor-binding protein complex acid labile subunit n=1 Tax=Drosophila novamexicana TaxID=47314 RepID=UPI0011E5BFD5|nr:insulin-like growth factor-binding protein complex acid labile subunit [Drosophila novamexicana]
MYKLCLLLLLGAQCLLSAPVYDENERLNLSASCPDTVCHLWELQSDYQRPLRYAGGQVPQLQQLLLGNSRMRVLPVELLRQAPNLRSLLVQNCSVYHVNKEDFQATPQLRELLLQRNHIARLKEQQFGTLQQLQVLQLDHNIIQVVHANAFEGLAQLQLLGLQGNGITQLMEGAFGALTNLRHLDLSDNEIRQINGQTFAGNGKLQTLLLSGNQLAQFEPNSLAALSQLRLLDLSNCGQLEELHLLGAQRLLLEGSGVRRLIIDGGVINLQAGKNTLTQLSIGDKSAVIELDLHGNQLSGNATWSLLQGMWNLQRLDLAKNQIESLSSADSLSLLLPSLTHLNLAHNQLRSLPPDTALLPTHLLQLDISYNHMLAVSAQNFAALPRLQRLHMEGNRLHQFDHEIFHRQHPHLQELGICDTEGSYSFMHKMLLYLSDRGVHLPVHCLHKPDSNMDARATLDELAQPDAAQAQTRAGVTGIHPYWTTRDVLAFLTLLVVFIILLMQLYRILEEEGWLRRMQHWIMGRQPAVPNGTRPGRLDEQDSQSSSD